MNLVQLLMPPMIQGMQKDALYQALGGSSDVRASSGSNGLVVLTNGTILRCVKNYYQRRDGVETKVKIANECHAVHKSFGIHGISANSCTRCHMRCMDLLDQNELAVKKEKSSTKRRR